MSTKINVNVKSIIVSKMTRHCAGTVQMREESERGIKSEKRHDLRREQKMEREGAEVMCDGNCSTDERMRQKTLSVAESGQMSRLVNVQKISGKCLREETGFSR